MWQDTRTRFARLEDRVTAALQIILDNSIIIASLRSRQGASAVLMSLVGTRLLDICVSTPMVLKYEELLTRHQQELGLSLTEIAGFVDAICAVAKHRHVHVTSLPSLKEQQDEFIFDLAGAANCDVIVTTSKRDFADVEAFGIRLLTVQEFLRKIGVIT